MAGKKPTIQELNKTIAQMRETNKALMETHVKDQREINELKSIQNEGLRQIEEMYQGIMKILVRQFGEDVRDEDTEDVIGKRIEVFLETIEGEFQNRVYFEADGSTRITLGIIYPVKEGEDNAEDKPGKED